MIVAIDGPAGAGKSTVARRLADRLGFRYVDTGAMYRAATWLALERDTPLGDGAALAALVGESPVELDGDRVRVARTDVTEAIRTARIDAHVSEVSRHEELRRVMRARQRELADETDSVLEGRDIGRVVCPHAEVKVWLTADEAERARRRGLERPGEDAVALTGRLRRRDERDAPQTQPAGDAVEIDTTGLEVDEVVARIEKLVRQRRRLDAARVHGGSETRGRGEGGDPQGGGGVVGEP
jgi:cytidylate kinase